MTQSHFSLTWESYKASICTGFSSLQQNGEFVDMTLAADGHLVKVHQALIALSSPYLKKIISLVPSQHPVIFLYNISHANLCFLLEYIYTGQVLVPTKHLESFIQAAKALHIKGLHQVDIQQNPTEAINTASDVDMLNDNVKSGVLEPDKETSTSPAGIPKRRKRKPPTPATVPQGLTCVDEDADTDGGDAGFTDDDGGVGGGGAGGLKGALQFTVSNRGSVQVVFNRFMYNLYSARAGGERRWRCLGYRPWRGAERCLAYIVTQDDRVLRRVNLHNHPFHDKKILEKVKKNLVFGALDQVENFNNSERAEATAAVDPDSDYDLNDPFKHLKNNKT